MCSVKLETTKDRYIISIDQRLISKVVLLQLLENLRVEALAGGVDFQDDIMNLGKEMKESW